ncbi:unnamed protein product, partial [Prorocentrum cordatum]
AREAAGGCCAARWRPTTPRWPPPGIGRPSPAPRSRRSRAWPAWACRAAGSCSRSSGGASAGARPGPWSAM